MFLNSHPSLLPPGGSQPGVCGSPVVTPCDTLGKLLILWGPGCVGQGLHLARVLHARDISCATLIQQDGPVSWCFTLANCLSISLCIGPERINFVPVELFTGSCAYRLRPWSTANSWRKKRCVFLQAGHCSA